jgi:hypothetical protein
MMNESLRLKETMGCEIVRAAQPAAPAVADAFAPKGRFVIELWRNGKRIHEWQFDNAVTTEGKNKLYSTMFKSGTQLATWYASLISSAGYTALAATDTYANIGQAGDQWSEFTTYNDDANGQSSATRPTMTLGTPSGGGIATSASAVFDITTGGTVKGAFIVGGANAQTKADHTAGNTLWSEGLFSGGDQAVNIGDQLKVSYSLTS